MAGTTRRRFTRSRPSGHIRRGATAPGGRKPRQPETMKTSRVAVALLIALTPCTLVAPAVAQTPGAEDPITASARARFKEGVDFYDKGEYDQARASFLQAYALKKHPAVLLNLAWSCVKSGHALEGKKYFE